jgi:peptidoglycan-associated lipoprotein
MKKTIVICIIIFCFCGKGSSQSNEFKLTDTIVNVGDSCFLKFGMSECYSLPKYGICPQDVPLRDAIRSFLWKNISISIEIRSYSDLRGSLLFNDTLTLKRALFIKNGILYQTNINPDRISTTGFGKRIPIIVTNEINKKYNFLPVGQILNKEFILTLDKMEEREIAYQLNDRLTIKIIKK